MDTSVVKQIEEIKASAESMVASEPARIGAASAGDVVRQGDLYLVCLNAEPQGTVISERQLAPGTTQGSRHVADGDCEVLRVASPESILKSVPAELIGPAVVCRGDVTITHPEHGHRTLPAGSSWIVVYQRQYSEEVRRVQD